MNADRMLIGHALYTAVAGGLCGLAIYVTPRVELTVIPLSVGLGLLVLLATHGYYYARSRQGAPEPII